MFVRRALPALAGGLCLALAACSSPAAPSTGTSGTVTSSSTAAAPGGAASGTPSAQASGSVAPSASDSNGTPNAERVADPITGDGAVTLSFAGDIHFEEKLADEARDPEGLAKLKPLLGAADFTIVNLESAISDGSGSSQPDKQFTFHTPSSAFTTLANAGVDVVGMANNHSGDWNTGGIRDTLKAKKDAPAQILGMGANADEANAPAVLKKDGVSIAVLNASALWEKTTEFHTASDTNPGIPAFGVDAKPEADARFLAAVKDSIAKYDVVIAFLHYGTELESCATDKQVQVMERLKEAGVDAVIGGHSHRVQAGGWVGKTYVNYGLGSFVWWMRGSDPTTGILTVSVDKDAVQAKRDALAAGTEVPATITQEKWTPMEIGSSGIPFKVTGDTADEFLAKRDKLRSCSGDLSSQPG